MTQNEKGVQTGALCLWKSVSDLGPATAATSTSATAAASTAATAAPACAPASASPGTACTVAQAFARTVTGIGKHDDFGPDRLGNGIQLGPAHVIGPELDLDPGNSDHAEAGLLQSGFNPATRAYENLTHNVLLV